MLDPSLLTSLQLEATVYDTAFFVVQSIAVCSVFYVSMDIGCRIFNVRTKFMLAAGVFLSLLVTVSDYDATQRLLTAPKNYKSLVGMPLIELSGDVEKTIPPENRKLTIIIAKNAYKNDGKIVQHLNDAGELILFSPSESDIKDRDKLVAIEASSDLLAAQAIKFKYRWLSTLSVAALFGYCLGAAWRQKPKEK